MENSDLGRVGVAETGPRASTEPLSTQGLGPTGFDPARCLAIGRGWTNEECRCPICVDAIKSRDPLFAAPTTAHEAAVAEEVVARSLAFGSGAAVLRAGAILALRLNDEVAAR